MILTRTPKNDPPDRQTPVPAQRHFARGLAAALAVTGVAALAVTATGPAIAARAGTLTVGAQGGTLIVTARGGTPAVASDRGRLVSVAPLRTPPPQATVRAELTADGFSATPARYGVRSYRLIYRTVDAKGRPTTASGLMVL